jgi:hypothetical protein
MVEDLQKRLTATEAMLGDAIRKEEAMREKRLRLEGAVLTLRSLIAEAAEAGAEKVGDETQEGQNAQVH